MRILLVSYYFPPDTAVGAIRPAKVVSALRARGHDVEVIAASNASADEPGGKLHRVRPLRNPRELYTSSRLNSRQSAATNGAGSADVGGGAAVPTSVPRWKRLLFSFLWLPDDRQGFIWPAFRMARSLAESAPFDVIYTSAPPFSTHLVGWLLNSTSGTRWIAEFRDPWLDGVPKPWHVRSTLSDAADRKLEQTCLRRASEVVAVTYTAAEKIGAKRAVLGKSAPRIVLNGIDAIERAERTRSDGPIRAVHMGSLYHSRDPRMLLEAIARLHRAGQLPGRGLRVEFVGDARWYGDLSIEAFARTLEIGDIVSVRDTVPHAQAAQILGQSDLLILLAQQQPAQVPNKLYEYLGQRKPIIAFADDAGETAAMLRRAGQHFVVTEHDGERVTQTVGAALDAAANRTWAANDDQLEAWGTERQMASIVSLVED